MQLRTKQIAIAGICGAIGAVLAFTPLGLIPVPNLAGAATTLHIPAIVAGIFGGPLVGAFTGLILAISSWIMFSGSFLTFAGGNLLVALLAAFLPRLLIGVLAYYAFRAIRLSWLGSLVASLVGTLTNTVGVLGIIYFFGDPVMRPAILPIILLNPVVELAFAIVVVEPLVLTLSRNLPSFMPQNEKKGVSFPRCMPESGTPPPVVGNLAALTRLLEDGLFSREEWEKAKQLYLDQTPAKHEESIGAIRSLYDLRQSGALSESEFNLKKWEILSRI
jgi:uncharacterized membrane protein